MKKITNYLVLTFLAVLMISCGSNPNEQLYGTWKQTEVKITNEDGSDLSADKEDAKNTLEKSILDKNTVYEFKAGEGDFDLFTIKSLDEDRKGEFTAVELDGQVQVLLVDDEAQENGATKILIDEISGDKMTTSFSLEEMKITYVFKKQ